MKDVNATTIGIRPDGKLDWANDQRPTADGRLVTHSQRTHLHAQWCRAHRYSFTTSQKRLLPLLVVEPVLKKDICDDLLLSFHFHDARTYKHPASNAVCMLWAVSVIQMLYVRRPKRETSCYDELEG